MRFGNTRVPARPIERVLMFVNPGARRGRHSLESARAEFERMQIRCDTIVTRAAGHAAEVAPERAMDYDAIFALGGDGTAIEVIDSLAADSRPVGVLPGGTGNLLARALGIPLGVRRAVRALVAGDEIRVDLGRLGNGRRFVIGAGVGIDASMIAATTAEWKSRAGVLAYVATGTAHVLRRERFGVTVTVDGHSVTRPASVVLVANLGVLLNGLIALGPGITADDGLLDVCIFDPLTVADAARITAKLIFREFTAHSSMTYLRGRNVTVETDPPRPMQADGELIGPTPFAASADPLAARLLVPHCQINRQ